MNSQNFQKNNTSNKKLSELSALSGLPDGWTWVKLGDVIDKISTTGMKLKQKEYLKEGKYPVVDQGKELIGSYSNNKNVVVNCELPVIIFGGHTKVKKFIDFKFIAGADGVKVIKSKKIFNPKLFYYFLHCIKFPNKGYARHFQFVEKSYLPLPPLSEQKKIIEKIEKLFSVADKLEQTIDEGLKKAEQLR
jgi:type I restriction enzyme S subunit